MMAVEKELLVQLLAGRDPRELFGKDGLVDELCKALLLTKPRCFATTFWPMTILRTF